MLFHINKKKIEEIIHTLINYTDSSDSFDSNKCFYIKINSDFLHVIANSNSIAAQIKTKVDENKIRLEKKGEILINALMLKDVISKLEGFITIQEKNNSILIYDVYSIFELSKKQTESFRKVEFDQHDNVFSVESKELKNVIKNASVSPSAANENTTDRRLKYINIKGKKEENKIVLYSTNFSRFSTDSLNVDNVNEFDFLVDAKSLKKLLPQSAPKDVNLFINEDRIGVFYDDIKIFLRVAKEKYLNVDSLFKLSKYTEVLIEKSEFLSLIQKVYFLSSEQKKIYIELNNENQMKLNYEVSEIGKSETISSSLTVNGPKVKVAFNYVYLHDALQTLNEGLVSAKFVLSNDDENKCTRIILKSTENDSNIQIIAALMF
ncbi:DNA polymerase III subunit beta [Mycoplasmopsis synoviae]|uniref:DNA polymerase III subunit beta n=1 Tax=Mycoplasmopsis synoviae TaxID=2109 RepID=UPI0035662B37